MKENTTVVTISAKTLSIIILVAIIVSVATFFFIHGSVQISSNPNTPISDVVSMVEGKQFIDITVQAGYSPRVIQAKAGVPTVLRMNSKNAYGCESSFRIPKLNVSQILPSNGTTDIDLGVQQAGAIFTGTCSMGMYSVRLAFN